MVLCERKKNDHKSECSFFWIYFMFDFSIYNCSLQIDFQCLHLIKIMYKKRELIPFNRNKHAFVRLIDCHSITQIIFKHILIPIVISFHLFSIFNREISILLCFVLLAYSYKLGFFFCFDFIQLSFYFIVFKHLFFSTSFFRFVCFFFFLLLILYHT